MYTESNVVGQEKGQFNESVQEALIWASKLGHMDILETLLCNESLVNVDINQQCALSGKINIKLVCYIHINA